MAEQYIEKRFSHYSVKTLEIQRRVESVIQGIRVTNEQHHWFQVRDVQGAIHTIPLLTPMVSELRQAIEPFRVSEKSLSFALGVARATVLEVAESHGRTDFLTSCRNDIRGIAVRKMKSAAYAAQSYNPRAARENSDTSAAVASRAVEEQVVSDLVNFKEGRYPYGTLLRIYQLGLADVHYRLVDGQEKLVVHFPLDYSTVRIGRAEVSGRFLGCWVEGDQSLYFFHNWSRGCPTAINFPEFSMPKRNIDPS